MGILITFLIMFWIAIILAITVLFFQNKARNQYRKTVVEVDGKKVLKLSDELEKQLVKSSDPKNHKKINKELEFVNEVVAYSAEGDSIVNTSSNNNESKLASKLAAITEHLSQIGAMDDLDSKQIEIVDLLLQDLHIAKVPVNYGEVYDGSRMTSVKTLVTKDAKLDNCVYFIDNLALKDIVSDLIILKSEVGVYVYQAPVQTENKPLQ